MAIEEINSRITNQNSAEFPINPDMYVKPTEESRDDVLAPTIITIDGAGTIRQMELGIKNLAIKDNYDSNNNNLESKIPSTIASVNSRTFSINNNYNTLNTTEANLDIKQMATQLQNRVEEEI